MAEIGDLSITDNANTARFPENQAPSSVNNGARALEGIVARWHEDTNGSVASTGSANAYLFAAKQTLSAYYDGLTITFDANFTNTAAATLNVDSVSADAIVMPNGGALAGGEIVSGAKVTVRHDDTSWQLVSGLTSVMSLQTEQAASGTEVDFTGIPTWAKRITVLFAGLSTNGTTVVRITLGDSGGFEATGYQGTSGRYDATPSVSTFSVGFNLYDVHTTADIIDGQATLTLEDSANNTWVASGMVGITTGSTAMGLMGGIKSLSGVLTQVRIAADGADTFDAGSINLMIEG